MLTRTFLISPVGNLNIDLRAIVTLQGQGTINITFKMFNIQSKLFPLIVGVRIGDKHAVFHYNLDNADDTFHMVGDISAPITIALGTHNFGGITTIGLVNTHTAPVDDSIFVETQTDLNLPQNDTSPLDNQNANNAQHQVQNNANSTSNSPQNYHHTSLDNTPPNIAKTNKFSPQSQTLNNANSNNNAYKNDTTSLDNTLLNVDNNSAQSQSVNTPLAPNPNTPNSTQNANQNPCNLNGQTNPNSPQSAPNAQNENCHFSAQNGDNTSQNDIFLHQIDSSQTIDNNINPKRDNSTPTDTSHLFTDYSQVEDDVSLFAHYLNNPQSGSSTLGTPPQTTPPAPALNMDNPVLGEQNFYSLISPQLNNLFANYPRFVELEKNIENTEWIKVSFSDNGEGHYILGKLYDNGAVAYICYGIPSTSRLLPPPAELIEYCQWLPLNLDNVDGEGYWVMYQSAETGENFRL